MKFKWILSLAVFLPLMACNAVTPAKSLPESKPMQNNQTARLLNGKRLTSSAIYTGLNSESKLYSASYLWCQYTNNLYPSVDSRLRSGICYSGYPHNTYQHIRDFSSRNDGIPSKLPKASDAELEQLKQDLIQVNFASIQSMPGKPDANKGYWYVLFCYEDPAKPQERAKCMEATNPLTHPKTDAVMQMLQRFAQGHSMDPR